MQASMIRRATTRSQNAFTILEMLVVVLILSLLVSIAMPAYHSAKTRANTAVCQTRLRHLSDGYHGRRNDRIMTNRLEFEPMTWAREIKPLITENLTAFVCPEDEDPVQGLPDIKIAAKPWGEFAYYLDVVTAYPYWNEYSGLECPGGGAGIWKLSEDQYTAIAPSIQEGYNLTPHLPRYEPGPNPDIYYYLFEDQRHGDDLYATGDKDYEDIILRIEETRGGDIEVWVTKGYTCFDFDLIGPDGEIYANVEGRNHGPLPFDGIGELSYGMNWRADARMSEAGRKILLTDYEAEACLVGGQQGAGDWDTNHAPRHRGMMNVVFASGSVELMDPAEIDPGDPDIDLRYWDPAYAE